ncbi:MAG TPA: ester cyclase [Blastocatellia bacterium]|nr:ester cyclase [Blastocatellia bacterium]
MSIEENRRIMNRYFEEVWNNGDISVLDEIIDSRFINHSPTTPDSLPGPDDLKPVVTILRTAFPDLAFLVEDQLFDGDKVVTRLTIQGTHRGIHLMGVSPSGKMVSINQIQIDRIVNGKIVEHWRQTDDLGLMRQLGVIGDTPRF